VSFRPEKNTRPPLAAGVESISWLQVDETYSGIQPEKQSWIGVGRCQVSPRSRASPIVANLTEAACANALAIALGTRRSFSHSSRAADLRNEASSRSDHIRFGRHRRRRWAMRRDHACARAGASRLTVARCMVPFSDRCQFGDQSADRSVSWRFWVGKETANRVWIRTIRSRPGPCRIADRQVARCAIRLRTH